MEKILNGYTVDDATWFYLSLFLTLTVYFRFGRVFSLRNLDLLLLLAISPGILLVRHGSTSGYVWLFGLSGVLLLRLVADRYFTRRPRLDQNLNSQGLSFLGAVAFLFLAATAWNLRQLPNSTVQTVEAADRLSKRQEAPKNRPRPPRLRPTPRRDPGRPSWRSRLSNCRNWRSPPSTRRRKRRPVGRLCHRCGPPGVDRGTPGRRLGAGLYRALAFRRPADRDRHGDALSTIALHVVRRGSGEPRLPRGPDLVGDRRLSAARRGRRLMGLACGTLFFPVFLLPLWFAFYDRRGAVRFGVALAGVAAVLVGSLAFTSGDVASFRNQTMGAID